MLSGFLKNSHLITESAREFDKNNLKNCETQYKIFLRQIERESNAPWNSTIITDGTIIDNLAYIDAFCGYERNIWSLALNWINTYDIIFFCHSDGIPIEDDGFRYTEPKFRTEIENTLLKLYKNNYIKIYEVKGSKEERIDKVLNNILFK